jgi:glycine/D-amino acid oxidase-like deaminating enzyme
MQQQQNTHIENYDAIIIGQGLAGSLLAWEFIQRGKNIIVIDNHHNGSSSIVAAGIINPVTGHRINITQDYDKYIKVAQSSYAGLTKAFGPTFIKEVPQLRLIKNQGQYDYYLKRLQEPIYSSLIERPLKEHSLYKDNGFGVGKVKQTYRVDTKKLLSYLQKFLIEKGALIRHKIDYNDIHFRSRGVEIKADKTIKANRLICCEGYQAIHNPWFKNLPFKLAKGEILTLSLDQEINYMLNWGSWMLPINHKTAYLGASYDWQDISLKTHAESAQKLLNSMQEKTIYTGSIIEHQAGIRPTTHARKQLIGHHPEQKNLYCFNGFGSKGCLTIPHYANQLAEHICSGTPLSILNPELDPNLGLTTDA